MGEPYGSPFVARHNRAELSCDVVNTMAPSGLKVAWRTTSWCIIGATDGCMVSRFHSRAVRSLPAVTNMPARRLKLIELMKSEWPFAATDGKTVPFDQRR